MTRSNHDKYLLALAWPLLAWLLLAWLMTTAQGVVSAQNVARVYLAPAEPVLAAGETTTLAIRVSGVADLYGVELHLTYDPALLEILDADTSRAGVQLSPGGLLDPSAGFMIANRADNQAGEVDYALTLLAPAEAVSGDGILVSFGVKALADGSSELVLSAILASAEGEALPITVEGGWLTVGSGPISRPSPTAPATATPRPTETATPRPATASQTPTAGSQSPGQSSSVTPTARQPEPAAGQSTLPAGQTAPASGTLSTSEAPPAGQSGASDVAENAQAGPTELADAAAGPVTVPAGTADQEAAAPRPSPDAVTIAPPGSDPAVESGQGDNSILAGGLVVAAFLLIALVIFFGRRLLSRKL